MNRVTFLAIIASMLTVGCPGPKPNPCDDVTCPEHSCCEGGVCVCEDGWSGDQCDQEDRCFTGTLDCGSYGDCVDNTCVCHDGWQGELCDEQNPCYGVECGTHGNCVNGACVCDTNYYGETCSVFFDCSDSLVCMEIDPEYSGEVIVPGSVLTGYGVGEIKVGAIDRRAFLFIRELIAREVPEPNEGRVLNQAYGMTIRCVDANLPRNEDGTWNDVPLLKEVKIHFAGHRARVLRHVPEEGGLGSFDYIDVVIEPTGSSAMVLAFSDFLLLDTNPVIAASAPADTTIREVTIDFSGTLDEGDPSAYFLSFSAEEDGTPLSLTALGSHSFTANLSGGSHTLFAMVEDPYGNVDTVELTVNVDLCSDVTCEPWQTCRELDGVCVGADPCVPNPCRTDNIDYGDCDSSTGDPVCDCYTGFAGALCDACDAGSGYEGTFPDCQLDLCFGVNCPDDGDECNGTEACDPADGQCKHFDPISCPDDNNLCNGDEVCDPDDGSCIHVDPLTCDDGLACNGVETCDPATGCTDPADIDCGHGTCQEPSGSCLCDTGWDPAANCSICLPGYDPVGDECLQNLCYQVNCPDDGDECNGTEACDPADGQCKHFDPISCPDDNNLCNGDEVCDPDDGSCIHVDPLTCDDGLACNGVETCDPGTGCTDPADVVCGTNATCQEPSGTCACDDGFQDANNDGDCHAECPVDYCNGHGSCEYNADPGDTYWCDCDTGWSGDQCEVPPAPTVGNVVMDCGGGCTTSTPETVTFDSTNGETYEVTLESQVGNPSPGTCVDQASPTTCTPCAGCGGDVVKVRVRVCNYSGLQCADALSTDSYNIF